jgi:hypothetical protein
MSRLRILLGMLCGLAVLTISLGAPNRSSALKPQPFQSRLPVPEPLNRNYFSSIQGGRAGCGSQQSSVFLIIPAGFVSSEGADVYCTPTDGPSSVPAGQSVLNGQGYLIGIYAPVLLKPLTMVFEIDLARVNNICSNCLAAKYYEPAAQQWQALPTVFDPGLGRAYATIITLLPGSKTPGYTDRALIALFVASTTPSPPPTRTSAASVSQVRTATSTLTSTVVSVSPASPALTDTPTPLPSKDNTPGSVTPTATLPISGTVTPTLTPTPVTPSSPTAIPTELVAIGGGLLGLLVIILVVVILRRGRRPKSPQQQPAPHTPPYPPPSYAPGLGMQTPYTPAMVALSVACPHCGQPVRVGARFCAVCGKSIAGQLSAPAPSTPPRLAQPPQLPKPSVPPPPQVMAYCKQCSTPLRQGAKFCAKCGTRQ